MKILNILLKVILLEDFGNWAYALLVDPEHLNCTATGVATYTVLCALLNIEYSVNGTPAVVQCGGHD